MASLQSFVRFFLLGGAARRALGGCLLLALGLLGFVAWRNTDAPARAGLHEQLGRQRVAGAATDTLTYAAFPYDPNSVSYDSLLQLGLRPGQARAFLRFRGDSGTRFRTAEDVGKLRMLDDRQREHLVKWARPRVPGYRRSRGSRSEPESFAYNPNTVTEAELLRLGLYPGQAQAWLKYRAGRPNAFRGAEDVGKLNVLQPEQKERLIALAYVPDAPPPPHAEPFYFDPNVVSQDSLELLGFPAWQASALVKYRGDRRDAFREPEDLLRVRALDSALATELMPFVLTPPAPYPPSDPASAPTAYARYVPKILPPPASIDVNVADTTLLKTLPGIGPARARRIVRFRSALGGFASLEQVGTTRYLPDSVFREILPYLKLSPLRGGLAINRADATELRRHPYVSSKLATVLVRYREQHGPYASLRDLENIRILTPENRARLAPYLDFN